MSTYLSRPIFTFDINWDSFPQVGMDYNLRELQTGFGAPDYQLLQKRVIENHQFDVILVDSTLKSFEEFVASAKGTLIGFWLPSPLSAGRITAGVSTTQFDIAYQDLNSNLANLTSKHLYFTQPGRTPQAAKISTVVDNADGTERVTLTGALSEAVDQNWECWQLLYVRFAKEVEDFEFIQENQQRRRLAFVELTEEYTDVETGQSPVWLYHFYVDFGGGDKKEWFYTSFRTNFTSSAQVFTAKSITHTQLKDSMALDKEEVNLEGVLEANSPWALFVPFALERPMWLEIIEVSVAAPDTQHVRFTGQVSAPELKGRQVKAKAASLVDALGQQLPMMLIQPKCNVALFSPPCGLNRGDFVALGPIAAITANQVTITNSTTFAENHFALGVLQTGSGVSVETRDILSSAAGDGTSVVLYLSAPLRIATVGTAARMFPGCDKTRRTCIRKYNNFPNHRGHPVVPVQSLSIPSLNNDVHGNKK